MSNSKQGRFKDDIQRTFIVHSVIPVSVVTFICLFVVFFFWFQTVVSINKKANHMLSENISYKLSACMGLMDNIVEEYHIAGLQTEATTLASVYQNFYSSTQGLDIPLDFYILNHDRATIASSNKRREYFSSGSPEAAWGVTSLLARYPGQPAVYFNTHIEDNTIVGMSLTLGKAFAPRGEAEGYLLFLLDGSALLGEAVNSSVITVITDPYDHVLASNSDLFYNANRRLVNQIIGLNGYVSYNGESYYCTFSAALDGNLSVYTLTEISAILRVASIVVGVLVMVLFSVTVLIYINSKRISVEKTAIIDELLLAFEEAGYGNLDYRLNITTNDEFEIIGESYNQMLGRMKDLIELNQQQARATIISEIRQLESQFNPHFLYNTLETIRCMADSDPKKTSQMILWLASLLRYSIKEEMNAVTLREDVAYTLNYLRIQKGRFGRSFNYEIELQPETKSCLVPKLIIQPMIENSIKHGFDRKGELLVTVLAEIADFELVITITDNGAGISAEKLEHIRNSLSQKQDCYKNIGLYNVERRIRLMYGPPYGLTVNSVEGCGTTIRITLPVLHSPSQEDGTKTGDGN